MTAQQIDVKNYWKEEECLYLLENEELCPDCKGHGIVAAFNVNELVFNPEELSVIKSDAKNGTIAIVYCNRCGGEGKVDWIRRIRGIEFNSTF